MSKRDEPPPDDADSALFRKSVAGTRRLAHDRVQHSAPRRAPLPLRDNLHDETPDAARRPAAGHGVQVRTLQRLRRGRIAPQASLDLHGMTRAEAHRAVTRFLDASAHAGRRCVLIVHGLGRGSEFGLGVLRSALPGWLEAHPDVLASCPAQPPDGGAGASYVLLSRSALHRGRSE